MDNDEKVVGAPNSPAVIEELWDKVSYTYVNSSQTVGTNWDVRIVFGERFGTKVEPRMGVVMSHQHAKAFLGTLGSTIERIERAIGGPIRLDFDSNKANQMPHEDSD